MHIRRLEIVCSFTTALGHCQLLPVWCARALITATMGTIDDVKLYRDPIGQSGYK